MDNTTEILSHFIGLFELTTEEARLKEAYAAFRASRDQGADFGDLLTVDVKFSAAVSLGSFTPGFSFNPFYVPLGSVAAAASIPFPGLVGGFTAAASFFESRIVDAPLQIMTPAPIPFGIAGPPSSVAVVTIQNNTLFDNDIYLPEGATLLSELVDDTAKVAQAAKIVEALSIFDPSDPVLTDGASLEYGKEIFAAVETADAAEISGASTLLVKGSDAIGGTIVNGEIADESPVITDLLPEHLKPSEPVDEDLEVEVAEDTPEFDLDSKDGIAIAGKTTNTDTGFTMSDRPEDEGDGPANPWDVEDGHHVVSGGNQLVNEAAIVASWLDAPIIAVMKDMVAVTAISQINLMVDLDHDETDGLKIETGKDGSSAFNISNVTYTSSPLAPAADAEDPSLPQSWFVSRIEGDLMVVNWLEQHNFVMDNDNVQVELSSTHTSIVLGENTVVNVGNFTELGFGYDIIIVGGSMIDLTMVTQSNILIDNDIITYGDVPADAVSTADNLVLNSVNISEVGVDTYGKLGGSVKDAAKALSEDASMLPGSLGLDGQFADMAQVRVLFIEGDYVTINNIEQSNTLGDSDQVALALDGFINESDADITVTTGSNALMNLATVATFGVDSEIKVGGDVYSDALLYQAELIDTDADPTGVGLESLASEAVAFLADGMIEEDQPIEDSVMIEPMMDGGSTSSDVLTSLLA